jgi:uncharacterized protein (UPF0305 family)
MGRSKGSIKTGGRKKGSVNKVTRNVKDWLSQLIDKNRSQIEKDIKSLDSKERLMVLEKFMQYIIPKKQNVQATVDFNQLTDEELDNFINELTKDKKNSN